jgi:hypothetical protein
MPFRSSRSATKEGITTVRVSWVFGVPRISSPLTSLKASTTRTRRLDVSMLDGLRAVASPQRSPE